MMNTPERRRAHRRAAGPSGSVAPETPRVERRAWKRLGADPCPICLQGDVLDIEVRCVACGTSGCWHCYVTVTRGGEAAFLCSACAEAEGVLEISVRPEPAPRREEWLDPRARPIRPRPTDRSGEPGHAEA